MSSVWLIMGLTLEILLQCLNRPLPPPCPQFRQLFATENDHSRVRQNEWKWLMSVAIVTNMNPELASQFTSFKWRSSGCQEKSMISQGSDIKCIDAFDVVLELNRKRYFKGAGSNHNIPKTSNAFPHIVFTRLKNRNKGRKKNYVLTQRSWYLSLS